MRTTRRYPWKKWFERRRFTLRRGVDFLCSPASMVQQVRNVAGQFFPDAVATVVELPNGSLTVEIKEANGRAPATG